MSMIMKITIRSGGGEEHKNCRLPRGGEKKHQIRDTYGISETYSKFIISSYTSTSENEGKHSSISIR